MLSRTLTILALLFALPVTATSAPCWRPYVEGTGYAGDCWTGGGVTGFLPLCCGPCGLAFAQADVMDVNKEVWAAIGGGYRRLLGCDFALGLAGFFDYAHTHRRIHHSYYQGTLAGELYYRCFEFRANGYFAHRNTIEKIHPTGEVAIDGIDLVSLVDTVKQSPYSGFDLLAGYNLELTCNRRIRGWAGYYDYTAQHNHDLRGMRLRAQAEVDDIFQCKGSRFVVGGIWQYDQHRKHQASLILSLRIPLGKQKECCSCCSSICRRLGDPVMRRPGILVRERAADDQVGPVIAQIVFFQEGGTGVGTQADPTNLQNALDITDPGDVLFGLANGGDIDVGSVSGSTLALQDRQQLWGFDSTTAVTITVEGNSFEITELSPAGRPRLVVPGGATDTVTLANQNIVDGLAIGGTNPSDGGLNAMIGAPSNNTTIRNMTIDNTVDDGINLPSGSSNTVINNIEITNPGNNGILAETTTNTQISNVTIDVAGNQGIELQGGSNTVINNAEITNPGTDGILAETTTNTQISNVTTDSAGIGIHLVQTTNTVIDNAEITNSGTDGIFAPINFDLQISNVTIDTVTDGIHLESSTDVVINNADISNNNRSIFGNTTTNLQMSNITIDTTAGPGISLLSSMNTQITDATLTNVSGNGLDCSSQVDLVATNVTIDLPGGIGIRAGGTNENFTFNDCTITQSSNNHLVSLNTITGLEVENSTFTHTGTLTPPEAMIGVTGTGDYTFTNCAIKKTSMATTAVQLGIDLMGADGDVAISNCKFENDVAVGRAIRFLNDGAVGTRTYTFQDITMTNIDTFGIEVLGQNGNDETYVVSNCEFTGNGAGTGYAFNCETTSMLDVVFCENATTDQGDGYFFSTTSGNTGTVNVLMDGNNSANSQESGVQIVQNGLSGGMLNATVNNHTDTDSNQSASGVFAYQFQQANSDSLCVTIQDSSSNTAANLGINYIFAGGAGPFQAFPSNTSAGLATANPGINGGAASINVDASVTLAPSACTTPSTTCPAP